MTHENGNQDILCVSYMWLQTSIIVIIVLMWISHLSSEKRRGVSRNLNPAPSAWAAIGQTTKPRGFQINTILQMCVF